MAIRPCRAVKIRPPFPRLPLALLLTVNLEAVFQDRGVGKGQELFWSAGTLSQLSLVDPDGLFRQHPVQKDLPHHRGHTGISHLEPAP